MPLTFGWITLGLPLFACIVLALWPREPSRVLTRPLGVLPAAVAFVLTLSTFIAYRDRAAEDRLEVGRLWEWIDIGGLPVDLAIQIDDLSLFMMLIITGVGSLILLFATQYMEEDRDYRRFFAEMNFFVFAMLLLVMAANYLFLIVGWGLVGLASYLLIGYYYWRPAAVKAAKKAFVMNVIGDVGLVIAAFLLIRELGTLDYEAVFIAAPSELGQGTGVSEAIGLLLLVGAVAKSAQLPLHTWLEGSMEGPTPVSALLHAATMVTAGVYLIVRSADLYELAPFAADTTAVIGAATLFFAATIAIVQEDIKRVLAWSTVSQIGYMFMAAGLGLYTAAMFHLLVHAFFKALLFLAAGAVIHALHGEQSLDRMGGLRRHMPFTTVGFLVGAFALGGIIPFAGYFSKDEIIEIATARGGIRHDARGGRRARRHPHLLLCLPRLLPRVPRPGPRGRLPRPAHARLEHEGADRRARGALLRRRVDPAAGGVAPRRRLARAGARGPAGVLDQLHDRRPVVVVHPARRHRGDRDRLVAVRQRTGAPASLRERPAQDAPGARGQVRGRRDLRRRARGAGQGTRGRVP